MTAPVTGVAAAILALLGLGLIQWVHPPGAAADHAPSRASVQAVTVYFEYVPLSLLLLLLLEVNGFAPASVVAMAALLVTSRFSHAEALRRTEGPSRARHAATMLNWAYLLIASLGLFWAAAAAAIAEA